MKGTKAKVHLILFRTDAGSGLTLQSDPGDTGNVDGVSTCHHQMNTQNIQNGPISSLLQWSYLHKQDGTYKKPTKIEVFLS
ncbi:lipopolysaccharide transport periplasmic protein LptA [Sesbania bispinosa]|nr:lipopolysaccharide transport periplasmic protein LptA [Sesbania bispinosa]